MGQLIVRADRPFCSCVDLGTASKHEDQFSVTARQDKIQPQPANSRPGTALSDERKTGAHVGVSVETCERATVRRRVVGT